MQNRDASFQFSYSLSAQESGRGVVVWAQVGAAQSAAATIAAETALILVEEIVKTAVELYLTTEPE